MDKYYLQINFINKNNKKIISSYELYNNDKLIKEFDDNNTKRISNIIKDYKRKYKLDIDKTDENYKIYDIDFLKKYIGIPAKKVSNINKYKKEIVFISAALLGTIGISVADHKVNPDLYNSSSIESSNDIDDDIDFIFINNEPEEQETVTENSIKNTDALMTYEAVDEKQDDYELKIYGDKDDNIQETTLPTQIVSLNDNVYVRNIECEDLSNDELLQFIKDTYKIPILLTSQKYGLDQNWIAAKIRRENPDSSIRYTIDENGNYIPNPNGAGVGLLQIEGSFWNNRSLEDIDGKDVKIDCNRINNIANNHYNMDKVANLLETKNINTFEDLYNINVTQEELDNYNITYDDLTKYLNASYGIEKGGQIWEYTNNEIIKANNNNNFNYKLLPEECISIGNLAYNKGTGCIYKCLSYTNDYDSTINEIMNTPDGDNDYQRNIDCYLPEGLITTTRTRDNEIIQIKISHNGLTKTY